MTSCISGIHPSLTHEVKRMENKRMMLRVGESVIYLAEPAQTSKSDSTRYQRCLFFQSNVNLKYNQQLKLLLEQQFASCNLLFFPAQIEKTLFKVHWFLLNLSLQQACVSVFLVAGSHTGLHTHTHTNAQFKNGQVKLSDFCYSWMLKSAFRFVCYSHQIKFNVTKHQTWREFVVMQAKAIH